MVKEENRSWVQAGWTLGPVEVMETTVGCTGKHFRIVLGTQEVQLLACECIAQQLARYHFKADPSVIGCSACHIGQNSNGSGPHTLTHSHFKLLRLKVTVRS